MDELINQIEGSLYVGLGLEAGRPANLAASVELRREHRPATVSHASSAYNVRQTLVDPGDSNLHQTVMSEAPIQDDREEADT